MDEVSLWGADIYLAVDREIPGARITTLSGTFLTKVFEGPYRHAGKWAREMEAYVTGKGHRRRRSKRSLRRFENGAGRAAFYRMGRELAA